MDLSEGVPALLDSSGHTTSSGPLAADSELYVGSATGNWSLMVGDTQAVRAETFGWSNVFSYSDPGAAELTYDTSLTYRLAVGGQAALWLVMLVMAAALSGRQRNRSARRERA